MCQRSPACSLLSALLRHPDYRSQYSSTTVQVEAVLSILLCTTNDITSPHLPSDSQQSRNQEKEKTVKSLLVQSPFRGSFLHSFRSAKTNITTKLSVKVQKMHFTIQKKSEQIFGRILLFTSTSGSKQQTQFLLLKKRGFTQLSMFIFRLEIVIQHRDVRKLNICIL